MSRLKRLSSDKKKIGLLISLLIITIGVVPHVILVFISDSYNSYTIKPLALESEDGTYISAWLYTPIGDKNHGGIVVGHHLSGSKHHTHPLSSELAKRGFTVINLDFRGHGASGGILGRGFMSDMLAAVDYLDHNLPYITEIGLVGHSYGARMAIKLARLYSSRINATVSIGIIPTNVTGISNLLLAAGTFESYVTEENLLDIVRGYSGQEDVKISERYGNWTSGNNIMAVISSTMHLFEVMDPPIIYQTVQWFEQAFNSDIASNVIIIAPIFQFFSYVTWFGVIALVFIVIVYLSNFIFKRKMIYPEKEILRNSGDFSIRNLMKYYMIYVVLMGVILFLFFWEILMGGGIPLSTANTKLILLIGNAIGTIFVYKFLILHKNRHSIKILPSKIKEMCLTNSRLSVIYGILISLLVVTSIAIVWHFSVKNILPTANEVRIMMGLTLISFPFFLIKEFYFRNVQGCLKTSSRSREYVAMVFIGIFMDNFLLGVIIVFKYVNLFYMPYSSLYVFGWIIFSIIQQFTTTWVYMWSGRNILGSTTFLSIFFAFMSVIFLPSFGFL